MYVLVCPNKHDVYGEYYHPGVRQGSDRISKLQKYLMAQPPPVELVYPKPELLTHKEEGLLYYKNDTHWTHLGAYYGYRRLMESVKRDFSEVVPLLEADMEETFVEGFPEGDLRLVSGGLKQQGEEWYKTYQVPLGKQHRVVREIRRETRFFGHQQELVTQSDANSLRVLVFRDSFTAVLIPYISATFGEVKYLWSHDIAKFQDEIDSYRPDIVIWECVGRLADKLGTPWPKLEKKGNKK